MKKITLSLMAALTLGLASCDMDKTPYNAISESEALTSVTDFKNMRVGLYSSTRGLNSGGYLTLTEIQADNFNAVVGYSNTMGDMYRWQFTANTGDIEGVYAGYQFLISRANFILTNKGQLDMSQISAEDSAVVAKIISEAHFMRAFSIYQLSQYFCAAYDEATAGNPNTGVSYNLVYNPTSDPGKYPGRYTLKETYDQIAKDIAEARKGITAQGEVASAYITKDIITAFEARVALSKKDYATAAAKAEELILSGRYALCGSAEELTDMWHNDGGAEAIWQIPIPSQNELPGQNGVRFLPYQDGSAPDYIPTGEFIDLFTDADNRVPAYFVVKEFSSTSGALANPFMLNKFTDESGLWEALGKIESARFTSEPKPFRIAEMYLISAEAYAMQNKVREGAQRLNELKATRFSSYVTTEFPSANALMSELKNERRRELVGEGFRLFDLKRWGEGVVRGAAQNLDYCLFPGSDITTNLRKAANDPHMVWPIPQSEMDANPQMVQNPGY